MKGTTMTEFKIHMTKKFRNLLALIAGFAIVFCIGFTFLNHLQPLEQGTQEDAMSIRENAPGSPAAVLEKHDDTCWTMNEKPMADLPGAAIVQFNDGTTVYTKKHSLVDAAFNEALAAVGYGDVVSDKIDVIALCV